MKASVDPTGGGHREAFLLPDRGVYALSHAVGCQLRGARAALDAEFFQPWETQGGEAWPRWLQAVQGFTEALARLLGGAAENFTPQVNLSSALSKLLPALARIPGRNVLLAHEASFPSVGFVLDRAAGFERRLVGGDARDFATWRDALNDRVAAVLITHVHSNTGAVEPVRTIAQRCRELGIVSIVDIAQSAGIMPISLPHFDADIVIGSCVKWLCGGPGAGFMWLRQELLPKLAPTDVGWFSHREPFEFDIRHFEYADDARRFWGGTPSIAPYAIAAHSIDFLSRIGIDAVRAHNRRCAKAFLERLPAARSKSLQLNSIGGTLCVAMGARVGDVAAKLRHAGHFFDLRGDTLRLSFHIYNTEAEADALGLICASI